MPFKQKGFTLVELAITLVILGILIGGAIPLLSALIKQKKRSSTISYMEDVKKAIINFSEIHGRLPFADRNGDGIEDGNTYSGLLPYATLGVRPVDSYSRRLKYELNRSLGSDRYTTCNALKNGISGDPKVVDANGSSKAFSVSFVIVSAGARDADMDGNVFDKITSGSYTGDNTNGRPNYICHPPTNGFDDIVIYAGPYEIYSKICEFVNVAVNNKSNKTIYIYDETHGIDIGRLSSGRSGIYQVLSGTRIEIRSGAHGGGSIINSNPPTPIIVAGRGITINLESETGGRGKPPGSIFPPIRPPRPIRPFR